MKSILDCMSIFPFVCLFAHFVHIAFSSGATQISTYPFIDFTFANNKYKPLSEKYRINTFSIEAYIKRIKDNKLPTSLTLHFSFRQRIVYYLFWCLYGTKINKMRFNRVVRKPQFPNNSRLKTAKCTAFCKTCEITNRVIEQV
jgi:hypothetical protein